MKDISLNSRVYIKINDNKPELYIQADMFLFGRIEVINNAINIALNHHLENNLGEIKKIELIYIK